MSEFRSFADVVNGRVDNITPTQQQIIDEFIEVAECWNDGIYTIQDAASMTGDGWLRWQCFSHISPAHASFHVCKLLIDAFCELNQPDGVLTTFGWIAKAHIEELGGVLRDHTDVTTGEVVRRAIFPTVPADVDHPIYVHQEMKTVKDSPFHREWFGAQDEQA